MNVLNREAILTADDVRRELVEVPEWGGAVYVSTISAAAGLSLLNESESDEKGQAVLGVGLLLARSLVDEAGEQLFTPEDIPALMAKSRVAIERVTSVALRLNDFSAKAVEAAEKNSAGGASGDSPLASPSN